MRIRLFGSIVVALAIAGAPPRNLGLVAHRIEAPLRHPSPANMPLASLNDLFIRFPLPPGQESYADIDGRHMHQYVVDQAQISRKYRDAGHARFWGRLIGTSADATGLEASTRAYAKIIDEVNRQPLGAFQRPEEPARTSGAGRR